MKDDYISVMMFQTQLDVAITLESELCIFNKEWYNQFEHSKELIKKYKPDIAVYSETFYNPDKENEFRDLLKYSKLIITGSTYSERKNETIVFTENNIHRILKNNPSPLEAANRYTDYQDFDSLCYEGLWNRTGHIFKIKNQEIVILNCMEYYNSAYFIARSKIYNQNLFGIFSPCSSNNIEIFEQETITLSNHKENIYTFLCNRISPKESSTTKGKSYIYGMISRTEKEFLKKEYPSYANLPHICGIVKLDNEPSYVYGEFAINNNWSPFGRSDNYRTTPKDLIIGRLEI